MLKGQNGETIRPKLTTFSGLRKNAVLGGEKVHVHVWWRFVLFESSDVSAFLCVRKNEFLSMVQSKKYNAGFGFRIRRFTLRIQLWKSIVNCNYYIIINHIHYYDNGLNEIFLLLNLKLNILNLKL